jgi:hypothetical protein
MPTTAKRGAALDLARAWQTHVRTLYGPTEKPLTPREIGQLRLLRKSLGTLTGQVIYWALNNWSNFSKVARAHAGLLSAPTAPHIGFLLAHHDVAVDLMNSEAESHVVTQEP